MRIFVGSLALTTTEAELRQAFTHYGSVERVQIITDRETAAHGALALSRCQTPARHGQQLTGSMGGRWGDDS
jgi:RNA recognition motif-containing protein